MLINSTELLCIVSHDVELHEHHYHCYKVVVSFQGTYSCTLNGTPYREIRGHVVNSNVPHACSNPGANVLVYMIELESRAGQAVHAMLDQQPYLIINTLLETPDFQQLLVKGSPAMQANTLPGFANDVLLALFPALYAQPEPVRDARVDQLISYVETHIQRLVSLAEAAALINLSVDRTRHLFEEEMGAPFSQYVLWMRIKLVVVAVLQTDMDLGQAAHRFGFFDQSHFNKVFKRMFGAHPAYFLKKSSYHQFIAPINL